MGFFDILGQRSARTHPRRRARVILDNHVRTGNFTLASHQPCDLDKEELSRLYILGEKSLAGGNLRFLDVGGRDGRLSYLLGFDAPLNFNPVLYAANKSLYEEKYAYFGVDLVPAGPNVLAGDLCTDAFLQDYPEFVDSFDVVYSNNVFEHFNRPWIAAANLLKLLKPGGLCVTIVPFSQRYHESPGDYFRYTPDGVISLFKSAGNIDVLEAGFDTKARRYDWQGSGEANDIVPLDKYGAWRETWLTIVIFRKSPV
jgi:SAM-dependent methyltransferase